MPWAQWARCPVEIKLEIAENLSPLDLKSLSMTSKTMRVMVMKHLRKNLVSDPLSSVMGPIAEALKETIYDGITDIPMDILEQAIYDLKYGSRCCLETRMEMCLWRDRYHNYMPQPSGTLRADPGFRVFKARHLSLLLTPYYGDQAPYLYEYYLGLLVDYIQVPLLPRDSTRLDMNQLQHLWRQLRRLHNWNIHWVGRWR